jgi:hypothetical protein
MSMRPGVIGLAAILLLGSSALADTGYAIVAKNDSAVPLAITIGGKAGCTADAGKSCTLTFSDPGATFAYSLGGAAPVAFAPGNPEVVETCHFDAKGAHCLDTMGQATN